MTDPVTPAAPATPATPAATPPATPAAPADSATPPAAPAASPTDTTSLLPPAPPATPAAPAAPAAPATAVNPPPAPPDPEWFLADGVKGTGAPPAWYKADKYKSLAAQAEAYTHLEKRLGSFTGAPDGEYKITVPETVDGGFDTTHPLLQNFQTWARESNLSQAGFDKVLGMFAEYEASLAPDLAAEKARLGENADTRINSIVGWAQANLTPEQYQDMREATSGPNMAAVMRSFEAIIGKTRQARMPQPGADVPGQGQLTEADINAMQAKRGPDGRRLYDTDPGWRAHVEKTRIDFYNAHQKAA